MKTVLTLVMIPVVAAISVATGSAQTVSTPVTQYLQASVTAMIGASTLQDVTLSGSAESIAGADDETGAFTFRATSTGSSRIDLAFTSGTRSQTRQFGQGAPSGAWMDEDGVPHASSQHNLMSGYDWPFPELILNQFLTDPLMSVTFVGQEGTLLHFSGCEQRTGISSAANGLLQHLTQVDLWLDPTTLLPAQASFNIHPDGNAGFDIPVRIDYLNYQTLSGVVIPTHVQKFVNANLVLDAQIQSISVNAGLPSSAFSLGN